VVAQDQVGHQEVDLLVEVEDADKIQINFHLFYMKRVFLFAIVFMATVTTYAQDITDGLRYATDKTNGSARFRAMSGAFGALGGDLSATAINPAGSAIFLKNSATVSFAVDNIDNEANYFNTIAESADTDLSINQAGAIFVFNNANEESPWKKLSLGINYDNTNNYDGDLFITGTGNTSISRFFLTQAQGIPLDLLQLRNGESVSDLYSFLGETEGVAAQNAFLGFQGFIIDPLDNDPNNTQYISNIAGSSFNQEYSYFTQGNSGKFTFNAATQYGENFYFGINLNSHTVDYERSTFLFETNNNANSTVNQVGFQNNLSVLGAGFSAQLGAIVKLDALRLGFAYDTPTWYNISEETTQSLETRRIENNQSIIETINPRVINIFNEYDLQTPGKIAASAAYIFGTQGLLSFDYSYKDYSNIEFSPTRDPSFSALNNSIDNTLKATSTYRLGGEYRIDKLSLRGGYHYEESPYENEQTVGDLSGFSLGLGYNLGSYSLDLAYSRSEQDRNQQLYNIGLTDTASINTVYTNVVLTLGFSL